MDADSMLIHEIKRISAGVFALLKDVNAHTRIGKFPRDHCTGKAGAYDEYAMWSQRHSKCEKLTALSGVCQPVSMASTQFVCGPEFGLPPRTYRQPTVGLIVCKP